MTEHDPLKPNLHRNRKGQPKRPAVYHPPASDQSEQQTYEVAALIARALGDAQTLRMVELIAAGTCTASAMLQHIDLPIGLIDNRIFKLRKVGLVQQVGVPPKSHSVLRSDVVVGIVLQLLQFSRWVKEFLPGRENDQRIRDILGTPARQE